MIKDTDITNAILTWDALDTHESTFKAAIDKGADVFACMKENHGSLYDDCITAYTEYKKGHLFTLLQHHSKQPTIAMSKSENTFSEYCYS